MLTICERTRLPRRQRDDENAALRKMLDYDINPGLIQIDPRAPFHPSLSDGRCAGGCGAPGTQLVITPTGAALVCVECHEHAT